MANSFYWYDLETSGVQPKWDRIVQFAGIRTDADLNPIGDEYCSYVALADDVLPNPDASLITGITPQLTHAKGIVETQALLKISQLFSQPNTCVVGYNSLRFDDEFVRYGFYRNLLDPYVREWQGGNSRWDIIDLVRATGGLRRDGIVWPQDEEGLPVYKLEELTRANGIDHGHAHDAMSDVHATLAVAKLIKVKQPKLFDYYFAMRNKKKVRQALEPIGSRICVHVSGMYPRTRYGVAPIMAVSAHPTNSNSIIVVDLAEDVEGLLSMNAEDIASSLFTAGAQQRPPLKEIRINRCPFIAPLEVLQEENISRLGLDLNIVKERARRLRKPGVVEKIKRVYMQAKPPPSTDPDAGLYDAFLQEEDRSRCRYLHEQLQAGQWRELDFKDQRLAPLAHRMKARSFESLLEANEVSDWSDFVVGKLEGEGDWFNLAKYEQRIEQLMLDQSGPVGSEAKLRVLNALAEHAVDLRSRYRL